MKVREIIARVLHDFDNHALGPDDILALAAISNADAILSALSDAGYAVVTNYEAAVARVEIERQEKIRALIGDPTQGVSIGTRP